MKNILVKSLFRVVDGSWLFDKKAKAEQVYDLYKEFHDLSLKSFQHRLKGDWDYEFVEDTVTTIHEGYQKTFYAIYDLWKKHAPCNILYTDPDTLAVNDIDIWNCYSTFRMFNFTQPKTFYTPNSYNKSFPHWFNAGVRYFPAQMSEDTWKIGLDMAANWDLSDHNTEQIILNEMLWSQGLKLSDTLVPSLAWQGLHMPAVSIWVENHWNSLDVLDTSIIHLHASRDLEAKLKWMQRVDAESNR